MPNGFVNVLKAPGITSHDIVAHLRKVYGMKKIGHAGTLDPAAAGVLPIALGKATRMLEYMDNADKSYTAEVTFGYTTDSGDDTGKVIEEMTEYEMPTRQMIEEVLETFRGEIKQCPPIYSAVRINGQKAYNLARKNIEVEMPERTVVIHDIKFHEMRENGFVFSVKCSKGTYIRSLCTDIGRKLGIPSVMSFLVRTHVGAFKLENAWSTEEIGMLPHKALYATDFPIKHLPEYKITEDEALMIKQGKKIDVAEGVHFADKFIRLYTDKEFAGIGRYVFSEHKIAPHKVLL